MSTRSRRRLSEEEEIDAEIAALHNVVRRDRKPQRPPSRFGLGDVVLHRKHLANLGDGVVGKVYRASVWNERARDFRPGWVVDVSWPHVMGQLGEVTYTYREADFELVARAAFHAPADFTPGPWKVWRVARSGDGARAEVATDFGVPIVGWGAVRPRLPDAQLISAAPDMLIALEEEERMRSPNSDHPVDRLRRAAIAKARARS